MKFFSSILKQKKIITFVFFFLIVITLAIPQVTLAAFWDFVKPWTWGKTFFDAIINGGITLVFAIPIFITTAAAGISKAILTLVVDFAMKADYTRDTAVNIGWPIVRDLANMMVVLGFVVIGIATTLRIGEYEAKKLLPKLIIAALLINFSLLITGIFIDGSNIIMKYFFSNTSPTSSWIPNVALGDLISNIGKHSSGEFLSILLGIIFFNFIGFFVYFLYAILILARVVALWILVILSPLAFVCYVFPATKSIWQMWWKNFFQWCIIVLPAGLFYFIGWKIISNAASSSNVINLETEITLAEFLSNSISAILSPGLFLIIGFLVSLKFSAMGASSIMNFANKNKGKILGGGLGALSKASGKGGDLMGKIAGSSALMPGGSKYNPLTWAKATMRGAARMSEKGANAVGNYRATSQKTRSEFGRGLEAVGARDFGTTDMKQAGVVEEEAKMIKFKYSKAKAAGDTKTIARIQNDARTAQGSKGAASMKVVTDAKDLYGTLNHDTFKDVNTGKIDLAKVSDRFNYVAEMGATDIKKEAVKIMPELEKQNKPVVDKIREQHPGWSQQDAEHEAVVRVVVKMPEESLDRDFVDSVDSKVIRDAGARMTNKKKEALKSNALESVRQEIRALAPNNIVSPQNQAKYDELTDKAVELNRL